MPSSIVSPFPVFNDLDGTPLEAGYIYIGQSNLNPEASPIQVYWDEALTIPAAQPIRTVGGYASRNGSPGNLYVSSTAFSITVRNRNQVFVFSSPTGNSAGGAIFQGYPITRSQLSLPLLGTDSSFIQAGISAVTRIMQDKARDIVSVKDFGAVGDGVTDDTLAIQAAITAGNSIFFPWGIYRCKDIVVSGSKSMYCNGSIFRPAVGASFIFKLVGFRPCVYDAYFDGEEYSGHAGNIPVDLNHAGVVVGDNNLQCEFSIIQNCMWVNFAVCLIIGGNNTFSAAKGFITNCNFISYTLRGIYLKKNALDFTFTNIDIRSVLQSGTGGDIPKRSAIGFQHVGTATTSAKGGHLLNAVTCLNSEIGFQFTDSSLITLQNCIGDGVAGAAYQISTTGSEVTDYIKFDNCFAGTAKIGYEITGNAQKICISNATTILSGYIPPWGGSDYFLTTGNYVVARDIYLQSSANLFVSGWFSDRYYNPYFAGTISFESSDLWSVGADTSVGAGTTVYLTFGGNRNTEVLPFIAPKRGMIYGMNAQCGTAPGAGQSFTYTTRLNYADSGTIAQITGASTFLDSSNVITLFSAGDNISMKLVTSATANQATHRVGLMVVYFG